jgi:hypothetical protein
MNGYIRKQPKQIKERIEAKLDVRLIRKLESYCKYLESDRDYIVGQALEIAFRKDKGFGEWLGSQPGPSVSEAQESDQTHRRGRKALLPTVQTKGSGDAAQATGPAALSSPSGTKGA